MVHPRFRGKQKTKAIDDVSITAVNEVAVGEVLIP